jgi:hypothetical protein
VAELRVEFVSKVVAGTARSLAERIAALDHEAIDHPMKDDAVIERGFLALAGLRVAPFLGPFRQADEVADRIRRLLIEEPDLEVAFGRFEIRVSCHVSSRVNPEIIPLV